MGFSGIGGAGGRGNEGAGEISWSCLTTGCGGFEG